MILGCAPARTKDEKAVALMRALLKAAALTDLGLEGC
jgi:hypothetical protein